MRTRARKRAVIVGAGPGGLAASMLLAKGGFQVKVIERLPFVGGRTSTLRGGDGFQFDLGPTFFLYPRVLESIFASVGRNLRDEVELIKLDPQYHLIFGQGGELQARPTSPAWNARSPSSPPTTPDSSPTSWPKTASRWRGFARSSSRRFKPQGSFLASLAEGTPRLRPWLSLDGELERHFKDDRIRLAMTFQSKYLGMSPFNCPSLFSILSFLEYEYGVFHPVGGCGAVSRAMARVAEDLGVEFSMEDDVEEILFEGKRARRRSLDIRNPSGRRACDQRRLRPRDETPRAQSNPQNWRDETIAKKRFSCSTFMLYLGIEGRYDNLAHHTIYLSKDYLQNLKEIEKTHTLSADPSFYVQNACVTDPSLAHEGMSTLYVLLPVTHQHENVDWNKEAPAFRDLAIRQLEKVGIHGLRERIRFEHRITPDDWEHGYEIYRGATFTSRIICNKCSIFDPRIGSTTLSRSIWSAAARIPGAACR